MWCSIAAFGENGSCADSLIVSMAAARLRRLQALEYPDAQGFVLEYDHIRVLVGWLENQKLREYPEDQRSPLCSPPSREAWLPVLHRYLEDLDIAAGLPAPNLLDPEYAPVVVRRLLDRAIGFEYGDSSGELNVAAAVRAVAEEASDTPELRQAVEELAKVTGVPMGEDLGAALAAIKQVVKQRVGTAQGSEGKRFDQAQFPLGFSTGDTVLDRAATVLRLVHINQLRELQNSVNDIIRTLQEFTANPKTDTRLGKVGY